MKKVSIIIPTYAAEKYIAATIQSVLEQTYKNFELLLVDDGSPDKSIEICEELTDPRIRIIRQVNRGVAAARNNGIRHAQGEYIAFLDADDLWLPEKLEKHVNHLEKSPAVGVSFSYSAFIDEVGNRLGLYMRNEYKIVTPSAILCRNPIGNGSNLVLRREVLEAIRFQDNLYGTVEDFYFDDDRQLHRLEDAECWLRISVATCWQFEAIPEVLTLYRLHPEGHSANLRKTLEAWERFLEKARSYAPELVAQWEKPSKAYGLRYVARRAVKMKAGPMAVQLIHRSLVTHWRIVLEEPRRTLMTLAAAYALCLLPQPLYCQMEAMGLKIIGASQRRGIIRAQSRQSA
jgi:glycosyltransferase involved in cell wall biosynthesis